MRTPTTRTARGNRIGLALTGLLLLVVGAYLLARSLGAFGSGQVADPVYGDAAAGWVHDQRPWLWLALAAAAVILAVLVIRWLLVQFRSDTLNRVALDTDTNDRGAGRSELPAGAITTAVGKEIDSYPGVRKVHAALAGHPDQPELRLKVTVDPDVDLARVRRRITGEALAHARTALDTGALPTQLRLIVGRRAQPKRNEI